VAIVIPQGEVPEAINGLAVATWEDVPKSDGDWCALADANSVAEPPFHAPAGLEPAAGVVVVEPDGRVWIVAPSNAHGGYKATFAKGRIEGGMSLQATALREAFEESGLHVQLTSHLIDTPRSITYTRYYLARRVGGNPSDMGWESQAVMLLPKNRLHEYLNNSNDAPVIKKLVYV
jgi:ADP-ribose pyrophosphatase YjhB (NUDIX family)